MSNYKFAKVAQSLAKDMSGNNYYAHKDLQGNYFYDFLNKDKVRVGFACENLDMETTNNAYHQV